MEPRLWSRDWERKSSADSEGEVLDGTSGPGGSDIELCRSVALTVAVIGVIAAGLAQTRATKAAHASALDLFDRQVQRQRDSEEADRKLRLQLASLDDRKSTYVAFMAAIDAREELHDAMQAADAKAESQADPTVTVIEERVEAHQRHLAAHANVQQALDRLLIVAPNGVVESAVKWLDVVRHDDANEDLFVDAQIVFVNAVRRDLNIVKPIQQVKPVSA
ncbi:hypothetical protein [Kribbella endophytica]